MMRFLVLLAVLVPTFSFADFSVGFSYRKIPVMIQERDSDPLYQNISAGTFSLYWGDSLRGRDNEKNNKGVRKTWLNPNRGAGYTLQFNYTLANWRRKVDIRAYDLLIGKRLVIFPHLLHIYSSIGPSMLREGHYNDFLHDYVHNRLLGLVANVGVQTQVLKGVKFFAEAEFRGYGPVLANDVENASVVFMNKIPFVEKEIKDYYENFETNNGRQFKNDILNESIRFGVRFTF